MAKRKIIEDSVRDYVITTVFVNFDESLGRRCPPLLFETTILDEDQNPEIWNKYSMYLEALEGHAVAVALIRNRFTLAK